MIIRLRHVLLLALVAPILAQEWQDDPTTCGKQYNGFSSMIVGGEKADQFEYPWQAAFYRGGRRICGASLIAPEWIITAAHCVDIIFEPEIFEFRVGSTSLVNETDSTQMRQAIEVYVHPDFNSSTLDYDIALFKMDRIFNLWGDHEVNTVCLPKQIDEDRFHVGQNSTVTGWGALEQGGPSPTDLYEVTVPIYDQALCNEAYEGGITDNMICAGIAEGGIDSCQGDSGGPMVALKNGTTGTDQYYLIGIVSWGQGCAIAGYPGVYTRVTEFEDWISPIFNGGTPTTKDGTCQADEFLCRGGECIDEEYRCSGRGQCYHDTDEEFCDGLLKMFDVFYYDRIAPANIAKTDADQMSKEDCADTCLDIGCRAFDVTEEDGGTFICDFAMAGYDTALEANDANRTFNHFVFQSQDPGTVLKQAAGVIGSPSYFDNPLETGNQRYTWSINAPSIGKDTLKFTIIAAVGNSSCEDVDVDFALLSINGDDGVEKISFCLNEDAVGAEFMVKSTQAIVEMMTSDSDNFGFLLEYESFYDCNNVFTLGPGVVTSPNYPEEYPNSVSCTSHLMAPEGEVVYFSFDEMDIEVHPSCIYDYVSLYDGPDQNETTLVGRYCGSQVPNKEFRSTGRDMFVMFSSDGSVVQTGFKANFHFDIDIDPTADPNIAYISSLESELSGYQFGIAAACIFGALLIMVLCASLYTVTKRDARSSAKLFDIESVAEGDKPGYHHIEDDEIVENSYIPITDNHHANGIENGKGTQATNDGIVAETGYATIGKANGDVNSNVEDDVDGGVVNNGFADEESLIEEAAAAVAAFDAAVVESGILDDNEGDNPDYQTIVVAADVTPQPKENTEEAFPHPPPVDETESMSPPPVESPPPPVDETESMPPPPEESSPPPPPETEADAPTDNNDENEVNSAL